MEKNNFKQEVVAYILLIVGSALFAVGDVMFVNPYLMAPGGTYDCIVCYLYGYPSAYNWYHHFGTEIRCQDSGFDNIDIRFHPSVGIYLGL